MAEEKNKETSEKKKTNKGVVALIIVLVLAACGFGAWKYHENQIKEMQQKGVADLKAVVDLNDYREAEQKEIQAMLDEGEKQILGLREQEEIDNVVRNASEKVKDFKTDAQYTKEEEEEAARQAELERQRREEEAARQAAAAASKKKSKKKKKSSGGGCVSDSAASYY